MNFFRVFYKQMAAALLALILGFSTTAALATYGTSPDSSPNKQQALPQPTNEEAPLPSYSHRWWVNLGVGPATSTDDGAITVGYEMSFNYMMNEHFLLTGRSAGSEFIGGDYYDGGLLLGYIIRNPTSYLSFSTGGAYTVINNSQIFRKSSRSVFGVPFDIQGFWTPNNNIAIGLIGFANVNSQLTFGGLLLAIQLGNLGTHLN